MSPAPWNHVCLCEKCLRPARAPLLFCEYHIATAYSLGELYVSMEKQYRQSPTTANSESLRALVLQLYQHIGLREGTLDYIKLSRPRKDRGRAGNYEPLPSPDAT